jgi:hypothetical protein
LRNGRCERNTVWVVAVGSGELARKPGFFSKAGLLKTRNLSPQPLSRGRGEKQIQKARHPRQMPGFEKLPGFVRVGERSA